MTCEAVEEQEVVLSIGDTTFLDYGSIKAKRLGYGPTGNGGNGLILHSALAVTPLPRTSNGTVMAKAMESRAQRKATAG